MTDLALKQIAEGLHEHEGKVLAALEGMPQPASENVLYAELKKWGMEESQSRSAAERLKLKGVVQVVREETTELVSLGELGEKYASSITPELSLRSGIRDRQERHSAAQWREKLDLPQDEWGTAFGALKSAGLVGITADGILEWKALAGKDRVDDFQRALQKIKEVGSCPLKDLAESEREEVAQRAKKSRGSGKALFRLHERTLRFFVVTELGQRVCQQYVAGSSGGGVRVRQYDFSLPPPRIVCGRAHPYRAFLDWVRKKLVSLGFEEMTGDMVESEFWNSDALYMPQFHPARAIHDVYYVQGGGDEPMARTSEPLAPHLDRVAATHENGGQTGSRGWRYRFDREWTRRMILRSQGTALSARWMAKPDLKIPGKYFGIARCFRNDTVDATHAPDFFQVEGIVVSKTIDMTHLLGLLKLFAGEVARAKEIKFLPAYFPYTEPSVEVHIKHPTIGWMEMGGSGIFRPEVTRPLLRDPDARVIAWGLGLDRMAMSALGISDIRDLFSADLEFLRSKPAVFL